MQVQGKDGKSSENYTEDLAKEIVHCILEGKEKPKLKVKRKQMTKDELEIPRKSGHTPFDGRCKDCSLGGFVRTTEEGIHEKRIHLQ